MEGVSPGYVGVVGRFLVLISVVVLCRFSMMASCVGMMFLCFLVVFGSLLRHFGSSVTFVTRLREWP